ncbi:MAG: hypothetical protein SRB2_00441 [Desulfobacteraceae bacterium Eth-SRB2]|nr:MAG: hypothetical protein SRB2_00441 [Desulfobacteraceae bacterium Eth-SRB2]
MLSNEVLTIGVLEYWNDGIMRFGKMEKWVIEKINLDSVVKKNITIKNSFRNHYSTIPLFQYSIPELKI